MINGDMLLDNLIYTYVCIALNWDLDFLLKHVTAIHIHSCTFSVITLYNKNG